MECQFKVGDKVRLTQNLMQYGKKGDEGTVREILPHGEYAFIIFVDLPNGTSGLDSRFDYLELVPE